MAIKVGTTYSQKYTSTTGSATYNFAGIDYLVVSQDVANNTSKIRIRPWIQKNTGTSGGWQYTTNKLQLAVSANKQTQKKAYFNYDLRNTYASANTKYYLTSSYPFKKTSGTSEPYEFTVKHNEDGSKTCNIYAYIPMDNDSTTGNYTVDIDIELPKIPRTSVLGAMSSFDTELDKTLSITKYLDSYYDVLEIYNTDKTSLLGTIDGVEDGDTLNLLTLLGSDKLYTTMTSEFYEFKFIIKTYSSSEKSTLIGSNETAGKGYLSRTTSSPLFEDYDLTDGNTTTYNLTNDENAIVKDYSTLKISNLQATAQKKASIAYWVINDTSYANTGNNAILLDKYSTNSVTVYAQDSRGMSTPLAKTITNFVNYFKLTKGMQDIERVDEVTEQTKIFFQGIFFNDKFGSNTNAVQNTLEVTYKYKKTKDSDWITGETSIVPTISENNYSFDGLILGDTNNGFDIANSYDVKVIVKDKLEEAEFTYQLIAGKPALALFGNKVALGDKYNEELSDYDVQLLNNVYLKDSEIDAHISNIAKNAVRDNQILWDPGDDAGYYMTGSQTVTLSQKVSEQKNGIVLVWQQYSDSKAQNWGFNYQFIPKWHAINKTGFGIAVFLTDSNAKTVGTKYLYVNDTQIVGNTNNSATTTTRDSGIKTTNNSWVLTKVLGV